MNPYQVMDRYWKEVIYFVHSYKRSFLHLILNAGMLWLSLASSILLFRMENTVA